MLLERNNEPQESNVNHAARLKTPGTSLHSRSAFLGNQIVWRGVWIEPNWIAFSVSLIFSTGRTLKWCLRPKLIRQTLLSSTEGCCSVMDAVLSIGWCSSRLLKNTRSGVSCSFIVPLKLLAHQYNFCREYSDNRRAKEQDFPGKNHHQHPSVLDTFPDTFSRFLDS